MVIIDKVIKIVYNKKIVNRLISTYERPLGLVDVDLDRLGLSGTAVSPELARYIRTLPDTIAANDPRVDEIVKSLFSVNTNPVKKPVSLNGLNQAMKDISTRRVDISIYEGEWPDTKAIPNCDIPLPVDLFVTAPMIQDWCEGRVSELKDGKRSSEVIRRYAAMDSRSQPAIREVEIIVGRDGGVILALQCDGAHRLCAAKMRGDRDILCRGVTIVTLD